MADITPESLGFIGGFGIAEPHVEPFPDEVTDQPLVTSTETKQQPNSVDNKQEPKDNQPPTKTSLADVLRADREERAARSREATQFQETNSKVKALETELAQYKNAKAFELDPVGYIKSRKIDPETQLLLGQSLLFDLAPEKAPPELRLRLFESKTERERVSREQAQADAQAAHDLESVKRNIEAFGNMLTNASKGFTTGSFPESEAWFITSDGGIDHDTYAKSLMATANNIANTASKRGQQADLSPANIAKELETEIARRMTARDAKRSKAPTKTESQGGKQTANETISTKGIVGGTTGTKPLTESERLARAAAVAFRKA